MRSYGCQFVVRIAPRQVARPPWSGGPPEDHAIPDYWFHRGHANAASGEANCRFVPLESMGQWPRPTDSASPPQLRRLLGNKVCSRDITCGSLLLQVSMLHTEVLPVVSLPLYFRDQKGIFLAPEATIGCFQGRLLPKNTSKDNRGHTTSHF